VLPFADLSEAAGAGFSCAADPLPEAGLDELFAGCEDAPGGVAGALGFADEFVPEDPPGVAVLELGLELGLELELGLGLGLEAPAFDAFPLVSRGGASLSPSSIPLGTSSAFRFFFASSLPFGRKDPAPTHGLALPALWLCSAPLTVKSPCESPVCSTS
jgi:hypothetical protein